MHVVVRPVVERHDGVQTVVPAEHPDHDENSVRRADRASCPSTRIVTEQELIEQGAASPRDNPCAHAHADELKEPAAIEVVR